MRLGDGMVIESKTLSEYPNYQIYSDGTILNLTTERKLKGTIGSNGYRSVDIKDKLGKRKVALVHRLLAMCFLPEPLYGQTQVNHKDGCKTNNNIDNLEWASPKENHKHSLDNKLQVKTKKVICTTTGKVFDSFNEASSYYSVNRPNISACCAGRRKYAGKLSCGTKLQWEYYND